MTFKTVCKLDDLWEGEMEAFEVDGEEVLLVWPEGGELCAYQALCPHQDIPLVEGKFDGKVVTCRAHQWTFDGCTGKGLNPSDAVLSRYPIKVENGEVRVQVEGIKASMFGGAGAGRGHQTIPLQLTPNLTVTTSSTGNISSAHLNNRVGPVLRTGALAIAVAEAAEIDNPGKLITVDDKLAYVRVSTEGEMVLRRETIEEMLGKPFRMSELEIELSSFSGRIENTVEQVRFYFEKTL